MTDANAVIIERLAALSHEQWAGWAAWMLARWDDTHVSGERYVDRWKRQIATAYADLSPDEQESDRIEARKVIALIQQTRNAVPNEDHP